MLKTVSSSSGSSGFPITLGNTVITASSTTTTLSNLTLNNVIINGTTENNVSFSNVNVLSGNIANVTISNATVVNANITSVSATFPNSFLSNSSTTLGNSTLTLGSSTSSVGNLTLGNANITSVASTFPNSYLANSTTTLGNTTLTLGSTSSSVGNLTLANVIINGGTENAVTYSNVTINSGTATFTTIALPYNGASSSTGPIAVGGNMSGGPDTGLVGTFIGSANSYTYMFQQNTNTGTGAYSTYTIATNDYSAYANFGINNNNFVGSPNNAFNAAKNAYWYSHGGDAVFGSYTNNAVHFIANGSSSTSDAMTINANNTVTINALNQSTNANATMSTASIPLVPLGYLIINNNGTNVKIPYYAV